MPPISLIIAEKILMSSILSKILKLGHFSPKNSLISGKGRKFNRFFYGIIIPL